MLDLNLAGLDGLPFMWALHERSETNAIPVMAITAHPLRYQSGRGTGRRMRRLPHQAREHAQPARSTASAAKSRTWEPLLSRQVSCPARNAC
jgi:CheY-like chemotaxis protein